MKIGMYTFEIKKNVVDDLFKSINAYGFDMMQFDFISVCGEQMPLEIPENLVQEIKDSATKYNLEIKAINGTFNMSHPDVNVRKDGLKRLEVLASASEKLNCNIITLCTGTRSLKNDDPFYNMWEWHKDNNTKEAWADMAETMESALCIAEKHNIFLGLEPEAVNVVSGPKKARKIIDEMQTKRLKIIMDPANLFNEGEAYPDKVHRVLRDAFDLLGNDIILAHGKDILSGPGIDFISAGNGIVDFDYFLQLLKEYGYKDGIVIHGLKNEKEFPQCFKFIKEKILKNNM